MKNFIPGQQVIVGGETLATFIKFTGAERGVPFQQAIIRVGLDTRMVDPVSLQAIGEAP